MLLLILQRYYFESESQLWRRGSRNQESCCLSYKDTILKANHSSVSLQSSFLLLLLILQRYYFESESQLLRPLLLSLPGCCLSYKDTILKANHSAPGSPLPASLAVAYPTKILFWKRITARKVEDWKWLKLLLILQRYYFESESQRMIQGEVPVPRCCLSYKDTIL